MTDVDYADVQGIVRFGYKRMTEATYVLLRVKDAAAARAWLRAAPITSAVTLNPPPKTAVQVAFTAAGLTAIGVSPAIVAEFSSEFRVGMRAVDRSRRLGDVGANAPSTWDWGYDPSTTPHLLVMLFAEPDSGGVDALARRLTDGFWQDAFSEIRRLGTTDLKGHEPFGFADGLSQPEVDWQQQRDPLAKQLQYGNVAALGEILLGYQNEYGKYTERPTLDSNASTASLLAAADAPERKDLGVNGSYLVMRQLRQDVRTFWQFMYARAGGNADAADKLASAFVGRTRGGDPLAAISAGTIPGVSGPPDQARLNYFTFDDDAAGARCPLGAHIRRANPRNADYPERPTGLLSLLLATLGLGRKNFREDLTSSVRYHRIVRRGREYGPALAPTDALTPATALEPERGLHFLCLNANISRQFEFLQNAWIMNTKFSGMSGESDGLLGNREPVLGCPDTGGFTRQASGSVCQRFTDVPQFVTVRGGAYFFLPSLRVLRFFAAVGDADAVTIRSGSLPSSTAETAVRSG